MRKVHIVAGFSMCDLFNTDISLFVMWHSTFVEFSSSSRRFTATDQTLICVIMTLGFYFGQAHKEMFGFPARHYADH